MSNESTLFTQILNGEEPGVVLLRDDDARIAIIQNMFPEAALHWLVVPYEPIPSIEALAPERLLELIAFAIRRTPDLMPDFPDLQRGFSIKFHVGAYQTVPHAKLHVLGTE